MSGIAGPATERAFCVLAPNASPMTLDGTNTWLIAEPGSPTVIVIDPGPLDEGHLLRAWSRWVTPEFEERRYDTWFFVAVVPEGQRTAEVPGEADRVEWLAPAEAVARVEAGEYLMLPPTVTTLRELTGHDGVSALAAAAGRPLAPIMARAAVDPSGRISVSWDNHPELTLRGDLRGTTR